MAPERSWLPLYPEAPSAGSEIAAVPGQEEGLGEALHAKLLEHVRSIDLDGAHAQAEIVGDDLVRRSVDEGDEHLLLPRGERGQGAEAGRRPRAQRVKALLDGPEQIVDPERFL